MRRRQPEKTEQAHVITLLRSVGGEVYVLGTRRAQRCWKCATVSKDQGTRQTPGIPDVWCFLPKPRCGGAATALWVEVKAEKGRPSDEQKEFRVSCVKTGVAHVIGGVNEVISFLIDGGWLKSDQVPHYRLPQVESERPHGQE